MRSTDIATLKLNEPLIWHKPGSRRRTPCEYRGPYGDGRIWILVDGLLTTANIRNCTRPAPAPTTEASCSSHS